MKRHENEVYLKVREIAYMLNLSTATMFNLVKVDRQMKEEGGQGFLPNPTILDNAKHFKQSEIKAIKAGIASLKRGDLKEYRKRETSYQKLQRENKELKEKLAMLQEVSNHERD